MEQHKARFEVGDHVTIHEHASGTSYAGKTGVISRICDLYYPYEVTFVGGTDVFDEHEFEHCKEHKVLTILREYEKRKNTNLSGQESRG